MTKANIISIILDMLTTLTTDVMPLDRSSATFR